MKYLWLESYLNEKIYVYISNTALVCAPGDKISAPKSKTSRLGSSTLMTAIWAGERHISGSAEWRVFALTISFLVSYAEQRGHSQTSCMLKSHLTHYLQLWDASLLAGVYSYRTGAVNVEWKCASSLYAVQIFLSGLRGSNTHSCTLHVQLLWAFLQFMLRVFYLLPRMFKWLEETLKETK